MMSLVQTAARRKTWSRLFPLKRGRSRSAASHRAGLK
jgi:hypothetical protein